MFRPGFPLAVAVSVLVVLLSAPLARAEIRTVTAPETAVRSAPFEIAPELLRLRAGDRVTADAQPQGEWRRVQLPDGRYGFVRDAETKEVPPAPAESDKESDDAASADATTPPPATVPATAPAAIASPSPEPPPFRPTSGPNLLGVTFDLLPVGTIVASDSTGEASTDTAFAVATSLFVDAALSPYFSVGASPQVIFRVRGHEAAGESIKEVDLRLRFTGRLPLSPRVTVFGRVSPGFSVLVLPSEATPRSAAVQDPKGFLVDGSVGIDVAVLPNLYLVTQLGYQRGFQDGTGFELRTSYLHVGAGFAIRL